MRKLLFLVLLIMLPIFTAYGTEKINENIISESISEINLRINKNSIYPKINKDQSKVEAFKGTWTIFYSNYDIQHQDKLVIDDIFVFNDGDISAKGKWYFDQKGDGQLVYCLYEETILRPISSNYLCMSVGSILIGNIGSFNGFAFSYSENTILSGMYASGFSPESIATNLVLYGKKLTGYRGQGLYQSTYDLIQWNKRGTDNGYCIEIFDDNWNEYTGMRPLKCGDNLANFSPKDYVTNIMKTSLPPGFAFRWRIWSRTIGTYGETIGNPNYAGPGYEGRVVVP